MRSGLRISGKIMTGVIALIIICSAVAVSIIFIYPRGDSLTVAYSNKVDYEPLILATDLNLYEKYGIEVEPFIVTGGIQAAEALATGTVEVAAMGDSPAIILLSKYDNMRIVARYGGGEGMHRFVAWSDITSPQELEGKRIGVQLGSSTHGAFLAWCEANHLNLSKINLVSLSPTETPEAMATRQIDAMAGSEPWPTNVENYCGNNVHEIGNSTGLGNTFPLVLVTTTKVISTKASALRSLIKALSESVATINENPELAASRCCNYTGLSQEDQLRCMAPLFYAIGFDDTDIKSMYKTASFLYEYGKIDAIPVLEEQLDLTLLDSCENAGIMMVAAGDETG